MKRAVKKWALIFFLHSFLLYTKAQSYVPEKNNPLVKIEPVVALKAYAFNLKDVQIKEGIFLKAMQLDAAYLLGLKPDRFLNRFRLNAGLAPRDSVYGGWESAGVSGHSLGHYLSACSMMYAASHDKRFKERVGYIVAELALCQQKRKSGYVGAIPNEDSIFAQLRRGDIRYDGFNLNGGWVPWYTVHKLLAGLADAYLYCDNKMALEVLIKFAGWIDITTRNLNEDQWQKMLAAEHGGMNEVLANLYGFTGNKNYLMLARKFYHHAVLDALTKQRDELAGKHANTQIPKIIGMARLYELTGENNDKEIASFFWNTVVHHHSYVIGGNSDYEHFNQPDKLNDHLSSNTTETCNTYNMLKLTRHLFSWEPAAAYMDYYERALYNHILASQNSNTGMMCYYVPLKSGTVKQYNTPFESFWCCTGTGMENHVKYAEQIYSEGNDGSLYVNLFIPSSLHWKSKNAIIEQQTDFPASGHTSLIIHTKKNLNFTFHIRKPSWAGPIEIKINGRSEKIMAGATGFISINRPWKDGDKIELELPLELYTEALPDNDKRMAILYGPLVLAAKLSSQTNDGTASDLPVLVAEKNDILRSLEKQPGKLMFTTKQISEPAGVTLVPFYRINDERQMVYFDLYNSAQWQQYKTVMEEEKRLTAAIEKRTADVLRIGEMQPERDHNLKGIKTQAGNLGESKWRDATDGGWFSFTMRLSDNINSYTLQCTYWGSDGGAREFDILVDGNKIAGEKLTASSPNKFITKDYLIPSELTKNKKEIIVMLQAHPGMTAGGLFGCKVLRNDK